MTDKVPVGVLASGSGTNLAALIAACADPAYPARIAVVVSNRPGAYALERARAAGIPARVVLKRDHPERADHDAAVRDVLVEHGVSWIALAGYMRILSPVLLEAFAGRMLNIHPSLLPAFPGLHPHDQALAHGAAVSGCTVHLVDDGTDTGPIVAQALVPVLPGDDADALAARILAMEHQLFPRCLAWAVTDRLSVHGRTVRVAGHDGARLLVHPDLVAGSR